MTKESYHFDEWLRRMMHQEPGSTLKTWERDLANMLSLHRTGRYDSDPDLQGVVGPGRVQTHWFEGAVGHLGPVASCYQTYLDFMRSGRQVYRLSPEMVEAFKETSLDNLKWEDIRLPYRCFFIALPKGAFRLWGGYEHGYVDAAGIYFRPTMDFEEHVGEFAFQVNATCPAPDDQETDETYSWMTFGRAGFEEHGGFERMIDGIFKADKGHKAEGLKVNTERYRKECKVLRMCLRIALNLCAYLQQPKHMVDASLDENQENNRLRVENELKQYAKVKKVRRRKKPKKVTRLSCVRLVNVGFTRDPLNRRKLKTGHMVAAHWHHYWCGSGDNRHLELRWIVEYFRPGTDGKTALETSRTYAVEERA